MSNLTTAEPLGDLLARRFNVVYYIQFADRIKIGTTSNFRERMLAIPHDRVLALEPGNHALEHVRHLEFADSKVRGEWFSPSVRLMAHIEDVVEVHGDPRRALIRWLLNTP